MKEVKGYAYIDWSDFDSGVKLQCSTCFIVDRLNGKKQNYEIITKFEREVECDKCSPKSIVYKRKSYG